MQAFLYRSRQIRTERTEALDHLDQTRLASGCLLLYICHRVNKPVFNVEEKIDKIVGRRTKAPDPLSVETSRKADAIAWRKALGGVPVPRGVYRFRTHQEADEWLWRMIARPRPS